MRLSKAFAIAAVGPLRQCQALAGYLDPVGPLGHRLASALRSRSQGISIRFPRLVRVRDDKGPEETTGPEQLAEMYSRQAVVSRSAKPRAEDDFW